MDFKVFNEEFDPGSDWTLAACLTHASRTAARGELASPGGEWRTGEYNIGICLRVGDNLRKLKLIPHIPYGGKRGIFGPRARREAYAGLASWWGKGLPRRWSVAGLRGWSATLGLRHGPDSYGRQQWGILDNGRKPDPAMPRVWRRPEGCKALSEGRKVLALIKLIIDVTFRRSTG